MPYCKCKCIQLESNNFKPYITESTGDGVSGSTKGKGALCGGRETGFLHRYLEGVNRGPLDTECHRRLPNTLCGNPYTTSNSPRGDVLPALLQEEIQDLCNYPPIWRRNRIHLHPFPSTEKEWSNEASDQPETVESMSGDSPLQNGGNPYPSGPSPPRGLDGESGPERCLLHHPHPPGSPKVPEIHGGRDLLPG